MRTVATYAACIIATYLVMAVLAALAGSVVVAWAALLGFTAGALSVNHLWERRIAALLHRTEVSP